MSRHNDALHFILTGRALDVNGSCCLHYWAVGTEGPALIRIRDHHPLFFVSPDTHVPHGVQGQLRPLDLKAINGIPVAGLYFHTMSGFYSGRRRLMENGIKTWESDVRPEDRYLMERFINGSVELSGLYHHEGIFRVYDNPRFIPSQWRPRLSLLSLDIETGRDGKLYSIAMDYQDADTNIQRVAVLTHGDKPSRMHGNAVEWIPASSEAQLMRFFIDSVTELDPDVLTGWHVIGFDLNFLEKKAQSLGVALNIGRSGRPLELVRRAGSLPIVSLDGRLVIDGPPALRGAFHKFSNWKLDTVAHELLGRRKAIQDHGKQKVEEIERRFSQDKAALAHYNLEDAILVSEIFKETRVLEQLITRSLITGLPPDQVHRSVAAFDRFFLPRFHRKGFVASNQSDITADRPAPGALVFSGGAGLFEDVIVLDFKSLYPTLIRTFHIDPYSLLMAAGDPLECPVGIEFSRSQYILPSYLEELMSRRAQARDTGDQHLSQAIKILMNSMYGVMGSEGCRFYHSDLPRAITGTGRWVLESTREILQSWGYEVLYGDTDSVFVKLKSEERPDADAAGRRLALRVDAWFKATLQDQYNLVSYLELEYEKRYLRLFLPVMRRGGSVAVKRYAGLLTSGEVEIKGMEFVRSDSTDLAREFQYELYKRYFNGENIKPWIKDVIRCLLSGELDDKLVYRRRLSRPASAYISPPPHVKAVKLLDPDGTKDLREVSYLITPQGPVPVELEPAEIDYNHYVEKQLKPLANDVLTIENDDFDSIIGGKQLELF